MILSSFTFPPIDISLCVSVIACFVSVFVYRLSLKQPNENKIFEEKIRAYQEVIKIMNSVLNEIVACIDEFAENRKSRSAEKTKLFDELNDTISDELYKLEDGITNNCLLMPDDLLERLNDFYDLLIKDDYLHAYSDTDKKELFGSEIDAGFDAVIDAMRKDLNFETLDKGLKRRISGSRISRLLKIEKE
jgi:hypothetical protein